MGLATVRFNSPTLTRHVSYSVILPEVGRAPYPVLLQLHGHGDDHTGWLLNTNLLRYAEVYPLLIVLPSGGTSHYLNINATQRYEDFIMQDLWQHVAATFAVRPGRWAIGGNSMGGYGAMRLGCKYPERFASIWSHHGFFPPLAAAAADDALPDADDANVYAVTARLARRDDRPEISFDCGLADPLLELNRMLHAHLERLGIAHRYAEHPGGHDYTYSDLHVQEALAQHARILCP